jgi:Tfp pilus assembly protein PilE
VAQVKRVWQRLRGADGFGLIELMIAMAILNVGILALVAAFTSGQVALRQASRAATAATLADTQMELYRSLRWNEIALDSGSMAGTDSSYKCDAALGPLSPCATTGTVTRADCGLPLPLQCQPVQSPVIGADNKSYRVDTYITTQTVTAGRDVRRVTIVVRNPNNLSAPPLARQSSDFDQSTAS